MFKNIIGAVAFLSRIPLASKCKPKDSVSHFPFVGYLSGSLLAALLYLTGRSVPAIAFDLFITYLLFNAFFFDGLLDTSDAFLSQRDRVDKMEIMKAGNIGPMALLTGVVYLVIKIHLFTVIPLWSVLACSVSSKYAIVTSAAISKPAKDEGLGALIMPVKARSLLIATVYLLPFLFFSKALMMVLAASFSGVFITWISHKLISGITGDVFGAIEEIAEIVAMATALIL